MAGAFILFVIFWVFLTVILFTRGVNRKNLKRQQEPVIVTRYFEKEVRVEDAEFRDIREDRMIQ